MLTTCPAAAPAAPHAHDHDDDDVRGNALRDPAPDAKPSGTPHCKNAGRKVHARREKTHSNPAAHTDASKILRSLMLGAGPRATQSPQLARPDARATAADTADFASAAAHAPLRWLDSAGSTADDANAEPLADNLRCNNAFADAPARTAVRIL
jgi:hypothetical protein